MTWWMYALLGALTWGVHYNLIAKSMTEASPITIYFIPNILLVLTLPVWYKILVSDIQNLIVASNEVRISVVLMMFTSILGTVAVYKAIHMSNATYASLIEIAYPIFVAIFAYLIFKENHLSWEVMIGGAFIMVGTILVIINS